MKQGITLLGNFKAEEPKPTHLVAATAYALMWQACRAHGEPAVCENCAWDGGAGAGAAGRV